MTKINVDNELQSYLDKQFESIEKNQYVYLNELEDNSMEEYLSKEYRDDLLYWESGD
jgi:hypothetical protein